MGKNNLQSRIYSKSGDKGSTSLIGGKKILKCDIRLEAYGTIDELNAHIGLLAEELTGDADHLILRNIQSLLFVAGCELATEQGKEPPKKLNISDIAMIEKEIDRIDALLPKLQGFIIPGGNKNAAIAHVCRTICRRAERRICELNKSEPTDNLLLQFINRLSDYFFVLSRKLCLAKNEEIFWHNPCK